MKATVLLAPSSLSSTEVHKCGTQKPFQGLCKTKKAFSVVVEYYLLLHSDSGRQLRQGHGAVVPPMLFLTAIYVTAIFT